MLGQSSQKAIAKIPETVPPETLLLSQTEALALVLPSEVRRAAAVAETFKLFFVSRKMYKKKSRKQSRQKSRSNGWP